MSGAQGTEAAVRLRQQIAGSVGKGTAAPRLRPLTCSPTAKDPPFADILAQLATGHGKLRAQERWRGVRATQPARGGWRSWHDQGREPAEAWRADHGCRRARTAEAWCVECHCLACGPRRRFQGPACSPRNFVAQEINSIVKACSSEEGMKLLSDYMRDIEDPETRRVRPLPALFAL